jgi:D-alanyl-D-alanine carboxypeptidase
MKNIFKNNNNKLGILIVIGIIIILLGIIGYLIYSRENDKKDIPLAVQNLTQTSPSITPSETIRPVSSPATSTEPTSSPSTLNSTLSTNSWWDYPNEILPITKDANNPLVLVNKKYQLPASYEPSDLTSTDATGLAGGMLVRSVIIPDLTELANAASTAGISLGVQSGYRSYSNQVSTYNYWLGQNSGDVASTDTVSARAGHSQHQLGTAVDFNSSEGGYLRLWQDFNTTNAAAWLNENAWHYGFVMAYPEGRESETGYAYEGWHFRWIGKENASEWASSGMVLDVWLNQL